MNIKLALGVFLPLILILFLAIASSSQAGFSVETELAPSINKSSLLTDSNTPRNNVHVKTISIDNDFFMPRTYELPQILLCLEDSQNRVEREQLTFSYSESSTRRNIRGIVDQELLLSPYRTTARTLIQVPSYSQTHVDIVAQSNRIRTMGGQANYYLYDNLAIYEIKTDRRRFISCSSSFSDLNIKSVKIIPLVD